MAGTMIKVLAIRRLQAVKFTPACREAHGHLRLGLGDKAVGGTVTDALHQDVEALCQQPACLLSEESAIEHFTVAGNPLAIAAAAISRQGRRPSGPVLSNSVGVFAATGITFRTKRDQHGLVAWPLGYRRRPHRIGGSAGEY